MKTLEELQELAVQMNYTLEELMYEMLCDTVDDLELKDKEIERLNKIIDELEKVINECSIFGEYGSNRMFIEKEYLLNKLKELKEEGK